MHLCLLIAMLDILMASARKMDPKVVKGSKTAINNHPYSAFISVVDRSNNAYVAYICGSSILNQKILLTAAHCFEALTKKSNVKANVGSTDKRKGYSVKISTVKVHADYDERKITNDIALAGLQRALKFTPNVNRVALAMTRPRKGTGTLAGWGLINEKPMKGTDVLHETEQKIWAHKDCVKLLKRIPKGTFCGGSQYRGGYPSVGDSGSPLIMNGYLQVGLVSFKKTDISSSVIIYTDIPYFYKWIAENAGTVYCG